MSEPFKQGDAVWIPVIVEEVYDYSGTSLEGAVLVSLPDGGMQCVKDVRISRTSPISGQQTKVIEAAREHWEQWNDGLDVSSYRQVLHEAVELLETSERPKTPEQVIGRWIQYEDTTKTYPDGIAQALRDAGLLREGV